jgi:hypothetical protein
MRIVFTDNYLNLENYILFKGGGRIPKKDILIPKVCPICNSDFEVWPSRATRKYCSTECSGIAHIGENNSMHYTTGEKHHQYGKSLLDSTKAKISKTLRDKKMVSPFRGKKHTPEAKEKIRIAAIKRWKNPDFRAKHVGENSHMHLKTGSLNPMYGKPATHSVGNWFVLPNGQEIWLRSSYEERVVTALLKINVIWEYEPITFPLDDIARTYCPDFYFPEYNMWWEVKGYMREDAREKINCFSVQYPDKTLKLVYKEDIIELEESIENRENVDITACGNLYTREIAICT